MQPPRAGERYEVVSPCPATALTHWIVPFTGGSECTLPVGTVLVVLDDPPPGATAVGCLPDDAAELEALLVPAADRDHPNYSSYDVSVLLDAFATSLRLVTPEPP